MKRLLYLILCMSLFSCNPIGHHSDDSRDAPIVKPIAAEGIINSYIATHPKWNINDAVKAESYKEMESEMKQSMLNGAFLDNMPFLFDQVAEYEEGGKRHYLASFQFNNKKFKAGSFIAPMSMQVLGIIDDKMKDTLAQDQYYFLKGKFLLFRTGLTILQFDANTISEVFLPSARMKITSAVFAGKPPID